MEQLLVHCANAIESNDATLAQQILWVLNNIAPPDGYSNQRLTCAFLRALIVRAAKSGTCKMLAAMANAHCSNGLNLMASVGFHSSECSDTRSFAGGATEVVSPMIDLSYEELGSRLVNFARSRNVIPEFRAIPSSYADGFFSLFEQLQVQHLVYAESGEALRVLDPTIVVLVDEDADLTSNNLVCRLRSAFNYLWIADDTVDTILPQGDKVERLIPKSRWLQRMRNAGFRGVNFGENAISEVKTMLDEHAAGWGLKKEEDDLVLTWKGHNVVFATAWLRS
ncbi:putative LOB domain-containing protein [Hibiscus syriacus]|uniref:LOB domain-containing protein n=1 Tax=Hibiscus syriacus TaxID=106335 RepID=A0A6A3C079_HIBSY|nr:putative LOB domain-containing protein [Hibiscus syriacus]